MMQMQNLHFPLFLAASELLFSLRRQGANKHLLWNPIARCMYGDAILHFDSRLW